MKEVRGNRKKLKELEGWKDKNGERWREWKGKMKGNGGKERDRRNGDEHGRG